MSKPKPCRRCGSQKTVYRDGKLFCARCSEQIEEFFEVEEEIEGLFNPNISQRIREKSTKITENVHDNEDLTTSKKSKRIKRKHGILTSEESGLSELYLDILNDTSDHQKDENIGPTSVRIGRISKSLYKLAVMMTVEIGMPSHFLKQVQCIFQRYLRHCGVAFTNYEYTENPHKMFRKAVLKKQGKNATRDAVADKFKRLKLEKKKKGMRKLEQSQEAWSILQDLQMTENFELDSEGDDAKEELISTSQAQLQIVETFVSEKAMKAAVECHLSMDIIVSVLYLSAISSGCLWVTVSDIIRWIREDRGKAFGALNILNFKNHNSCGSTFSNFRSSLNMILYEMYRCCFWLWQVLDIDTAKLTLDFPQLISRFLYNLNLPIDLMQKILFLMDCAPPSEVLDNHYLTQQGDVKNGTVQLKNIHHSLFKVFNSSINKDNQLMDVFLSTEVKIFAYILLGLKLFYGFDGVREYGIKDNSFKPVDWIHQLKMRMLVWEGHSVINILNSSKINYAFTSVVNVFGDMVIRNSSAQQYSLTHYRRADMNFACVPSITLCDSAFQLDNPLTDEIVDRSIDRNDDDRIYAPIRAQAKFVRNLSPQLRSEKHFTEETSKNLSLFLKDFKEDKLRISKKVAYDTILSKDDASKKKEKSENHNKLRNLFPCAALYLKYPQPKWAYSMLLNGKENSAYHRRINKRLKDTRKAVVGRRSMFLSTAGVSDLFTNAAPRFHDNFKDLLELFAKSIGEDVKVLYAAFVMLETQIIDRKYYKFICDRIINGNTVPISYLLKNIEHMAGPEFLQGTVRVSSEDIINEPRQLRWLRFGAPRDWGLPVWESNISDKGDSSSSDSDTDNSDILEPSEVFSSSESEVLDDQLNTNVTNQINTSAQDDQKTSISCRYFFDWYTFLQLLIMRYW